MAGDLFSFIDFQLNYTLFDNTSELFSPGRNKPFRCGKALSYKRRILTIWYNVVVVQKTLSMGGERCTFLTYSWKEKSGRVF
jgi:hypothetical protein